MMNTVLILGSNSEVGQACAYEFAKEGFNLQLASRRLDENQKSLASDLNIRYQNKVDLLYFDALDTAAETFISNLNPLPTVVVVCIGLLNKQDPLESSFDNIENLLRANFTGLIPVINGLALEMTKRGSGTIIGISSVAGERGRGSNFLYGAAKAGFSAYLSGLRQKCWDQNVHVITVKPGFIRTKMIVGIPTPNVLTATAEKVAKGIFSAYEKQKNTTYILGVWYYIMLVIKSIPTMIFKRLKL